jgi:hypothetical protein
MLLQQLLLLLVLAWLELLLVGVVLPCRCPDGLTGHMPAVESGRGMMSCCG